VAAVLLVVMVTATITGGDVDPIGGGGTWQSLLLLLIEGPLVVTMSIWIFDAFRRHVTRQGRLMRELSRAAFATFIVHQIVAVGAVLATRQVSWPAEVEYPLAAVLAVVGSFAVGALVIRIPGLSRML
jgi:glucans biosynthesis protein C